MKNLIRGGQIATHSIRMTTQLFLEILRWGLFLMLVVALGYYVSNISLYELKSIFVLYYAELYKSFGAGKNLLNITNSFGQKVSVSVDSILNNTSLAALKNHFFTTIHRGIVIGSEVSAVFACLFFTWFWFKGRRLKEEKFLRGGTIVTENQLCDSVLKRFPVLSRFSSKYFITAKVPYPKNSEGLHTLILGSTGTGKTNAIFHLINQIRSNGHRAIIYDKMGVFTSTYYNSETDVILNPLDARSKSWSLFNEVVNDSDFDYLAAAFIPESNSGDPFWSLAAKSIIAISAKKLKQNNPNATNKDLADLLLRSGATEITKFLKGTDAASLSDKTAEKTTMSVMAIISAYVRSISYLHDEGEKFSIRKWIENDEQKGFLFISSKGDQHDSLKPLISAWMDVAVKSLLSLNKKEDRKIWIILDELPSLQPLPSLLDGLSQSRQFGGAFVVSLHSISQLRSTYGRDRTSTIASLCRNKLFFSIPDNETAEYCSDDLGYREVEEVKESISYGAHEMRDGVNLNAQRNIKKLVMPTELTILANLSAYLKVAGDFPIAKVKFPLIKVKEKVLKFIQREKSENEIKTENLNVMPIKNLSDSKMGNEELELSRKEFDLF
jgi:type IV conjugative transfer system coupling protein TraD